MAPKRPREDDETAPRPKKAKSAFNVGPDNLPDGTWRRKVIKIKKDLIQKAKVKKSYAKIKAREPVVDRPFPSTGDEDVLAAEEPSQELHPDRQAMLEAPEEPATTRPPRFPNPNPAPPERKRGRKPGYFEKETAFAEQQKAEQEARRLEFERRNKEKKEKTEERERFRRAMAKARTGGKNGQRKLGRESKVLLERVKRAVGES